MAKTHTRGHAMDEHAEFEPISDTARGGQESEETPPRFVDTVMRMRERDRTGTIIDTYA